MQHTDIEPTVPLPVTCPIYFVIIHMTQCQNKFPTSYVMKVDIVNKRITVFLTKHYKAM